MTVCAAVVVLTAPAPSPASRSFLVASAVAHVVCNLLLMRCYRLGQLSQVFPVARGPSPWLVAIAAATLDGLGVRHAGSVAGCAGWLFLLQGPALPLGALAVRTCSWG